MSSNLELLAPSIRNKTEKQQAFLKAYFTNGFDKKAAAIAAGYHQSQGSHLCYILKNEILELIEGKLVSDGIKAAKVLGDMLNTDTPIKNAAQKLESAKTILDRIGMAKKERLDISHEIKHGVFILPAKSTPVEVVNNEKVVKEVCDNVGE